MTYHVESFVVRDLNLSDLPLFGTIKRFEEQDKSVRIVVQNYDTVGRNSHLA